MPFNSSGVYTPASGATTAAPGDIIKSSVWNAIFTDISSALTLLGQQLYEKTTVTTSTYVPLVTDTFLYVNRLGVVGINLPAAASRNGYPLAIKDISGAANSDTITITPNGSETIEGLSSITIKTAYGGYVLIPTTTGWYIAP